MIRHDTIIQKYYIIAGESTNFKLNPYIYQFSLDDLTWSIVLGYSSLQVSDSVTVFMKDTFILLGGRRVNTALTNVDWGTYISNYLFPIGNLLIPVSAHGVEHISNEIYIFGGSATIGNNIIEALGTSLFYKVYHEAL